MSYAALMVYVDNDATPEQRVRLAANLADRFTASLIGLSALAVPPPVVADGMVMDALTDADIQLMKAKLAEKGEWFRAIAGGDRRQGEWRSVLELPTDALAREARSCRSRRDRTNEAIGKPVQLARSGRGNSEDGPSDAGRPRRSSHAARPSMS